MQTRWLALPALAIAAYGAGLLYETLVAPAPCCALTWPNPNPAQTQRLLTHDDPTAFNGAVQKRGADLLLRATPAEPTAWLRLAYAEYLSNLGMNDAALRALDTSYLLAPYGRLWAPTRLAFAFNNWGALTPTIRQAAAAELDVALDDPGVRRSVQNAAPFIADPDGRAARAQVEQNRPHRAMAPR